MTDINIQNTNTEVITEEQAAVLMANAMLGLPGNKQMNLDYDGDENTPLIDTEKVVNDDDLGELKHVLALNHVELDDNNGLVITKEEATVLMANTMLNRDKDLNLYYGGDENNILIDTENVVNNDDMPGLEEVNDNRGNFIPMEIPEGYVTDNGIGYYRPNQYILRDEIRENLKLVQGDILETRHTGAHSHKKIFTLEDIPVDFVADQNLVRGLAFAPDLTHTPEALQQIYGRMFRHETNEMPELDDEDDDVPELDDEVQQDPLHNNSPAVSQAYMNDMVKPYVDALKQAESKESIQLWLPLVFEGDYLLQMTEVVDKSIDVESARNMIIRNLIYNIYAVASVKDQNIITPWDIAQYRDEQLTKLFGPGLTTLPVRVSVGGKTYAHELSQDFLFGLLSVLSQNVEYVFTMSGTPITIDDISLQYSPNQKMKYSADLPCGPVAFESPDVIQGVMTAAQWLKSDAHKFVTDLTTITTDGKRTALNF